MASIKNFIIKDKHGNVLARDGFSVVQGVQFTVDGEEGTPTGEASYEDGVLTITLHNIKGPRGNGIESITYEASTADDGKNVIVVKTTDSEEEQRFEVKNGSKGTSITKVEQTKVATGDGEDNEFTVTLSDSSTAVIKVKNGSKGSQGETALYDESDPPVKVATIKTTTGQSQTDTMTQKAISDAITDQYTASWETMTPGVLSRVKIAAVDDGSEIEYKSTYEARYKMYYVPVVKGDAVEVTLGTGTSSAYCRMTQDVPANGVNLYTTGNTGLATISGTEPIRCHIKMDGYFLVWVTLSGETVAISKAVSKADSIKDGIETLISNERQERIASDSEISEKIDNIDKVVLKTWSGEDISALRSRYYIRTADGKIVSASGSNYVGRLLEDFSDYRGKKITITPGTSAAYIAFMKSWPSSSGDLASDHYCDGAGHTTVAVGSVYQAVVPGDCNYLYINKAYNGADKTPQSVEISGSLKDTVEDANTETNKQKLDYIHVDAVNGSNDNDGLTKETAVATVAKAVTLCGQDTGIILHGETTENIAITDRRRVSITNAPGERARVIKGVKIEDAEADSDGIYSKVLTDIVSATSLNYLNKDTYWIYQHDVPDNDTLIPDSERHPAQRGKTYRCGSAKMGYCASLDKLKESSGPARYYDSSSQTLYFKIAQGSTLADNPVVIPLYQGRAAYFRNCEVHLTGVDFLYGYVVLNKCQDSIISDCSASYICGGDTNTDSCGCFVWLSSRNVTFVRCEAARATMGVSSSGDGFNAHILETQDGQSVRRMTATLIDCWAHDCGDDGASDHGRSEVTYIGGLYEHNGTGVAPAFGSCSTFNGVTFRENSSEGLKLTGSSSNAENVGKGSSAVVVNCLAEGNKYGYYTGSAATNLPNVLTCINCVAVNNTYGYYSSGADKCPMYLYNCTGSGNTTPQANAKSIISTNPITA